MPVPTPTCKASHNCPPLPTRGEQLLTPQDLAEQCQLSVRTLQREIAAGKLRCLRLGRQVRFHRQDINAWLTGAYSE